MYDTLLRIVVNLKPSKNMQIKHMNVEKRITEDQSFNQTFTVI